MPPGQRERLGQAHRRAREDRCDECKDQLIEKGMQKLNWQGQQAKASRQETSPQQNFHQETHRQKKKVNDKWAWKNKLPKEADPKENEAFVKTFENKKQEKIAAMSAKINSLKKECRSSIGKANKPKQEGKKQAPNKTSTKKPTDKRKRSTTSGPGRTSCLKRRILRKMRH